MTASRCRVRQLHHALSATAVLLASLLTPSHRAEAQGERPLYRDPQAPVAQRVADLLGRMTLEEKVAQMLSLWQGKAAITDAAGRFNPSGAPRWFRVGIGRIERPSDEHGARAEAEFTNAIQRWVRDSTRLGIPVLFHEEALHGLQGPEATSFPQAIALASSWNPSLVERVMKVVAAEVRARGAQQVLAPVVDIARDARWGRIEETYGEDPFLAAEMGLAAVRGYQGRDSTVPAPHVIATLKHMTGHGQPEAGMNIGPASLGERAVRGRFLPPFERAVREAGARSVMPSYNEVDGVPSHANTWLLKNVLRGEWGFDGTIVSDWQGINDLVTRHHIARDSAEAAREALAATVDLELPDIQTYHTLVDAVKEGKVQESAIDDAVRRLLRAKFDVGLFENPFVDPAAADSISGAAAHRPLALEAARQSIVLLKNDGNALPLRASALRRVALIGPHASEVLLGGYAGTPRFAVSIRDGLRAKLPRSVTLSYEEGVRLTEDRTFTKEPQPHLSGARSIERWRSDSVVLGDSLANRARRARAVALAKASDVAIVVVGDNEMTSREAWAESHLGDRASLGLPGEQERLVLDILATGTKVILVLINGRPMSIPTLAARVPAIVEGWYLGQETGTALAEVLLGETNPGGKLPLTVARHVGQIPISYDLKPSARRGYLFEDQGPLWPFGFGLSYTTFAYPDAALSRPVISVGDSAKLSVTVTNTGKRAGDEVVQLYVHARTSKVTRPLEELRGFQRITLAAGESRQVEFTIGTRELRYVGPDMKWVLEPGMYDLRVGGSSMTKLTLALEVRE